MLGEAGGGDAKPALQADLDTRGESTTGVRVVFERNSKVLLST